VAKPFGSPSSSSSPPSERLSVEPFPELLESLEDQGVELRIILSIQPFPSHPLPISNIGSPANFGPESLDNPIQTLESLPTTDSQLGLVIYPLNPLFDPIVISLQHLYNLYNQPSVPLELSPHTSSIVRRHLFPAMEPEGDALVTSLDESEVSTPHTIEEEEHTFPLEGFPYIGSIPISVYQEFFPNYVSLAQMVLGTPSASSLYHNLVWASGTMPTIGLLIANLASQ